MARTRNQRPRLLDLLIFAAAVSAQQTSTRTITLSSFELVAAFIPIDCLNAYNTPLDSCDISDFLMGSQCSRSCIQNLRQVEARILEACSQTKPRPGTLLDRTQDGELISALCGQEDVVESPRPEQPTSTTDLGIPGTTTQTTTVTTAITPMPPIASSSTRTQRTETETDETTTLEVPSSSTRVVQPPRSSDFSTETGSMSIPVETLPPTEPSSLSSVVRPPASSATTEARPAPPPPPPPQDGDDDDEGNQDANGNSSGSGGGGLSDIGFEGGAPVSKPSMVKMAAMAAAVIGWQAMSIL